MLQASDRWTRQFRTHARLCTRALIVRPHGYLQDAVYFIETAPFLKPLTAKALRHRVYNWQRKEMRI